MTKTGLVYDDLYLNHNTGYDLQALGASDKTPIQGLSEG